MFESAQPTPESLRADALAVGNHIVSERGVDQLVIHGESIGGMAAAGAARGLTHMASTQSKVALLICDRTFSNLQAIAQRLVGAWSGPAISYLAPLWNTDVAGDFLASSCPKLVAQDHADAIIADCGSLKSGISLWKEIRREASSKDLGWVRETPLEYRMAEWENVSVIKPTLVQSTASQIQPPTWPNDKYITEKAGFHFAACVRRIGKLATAERKNSRLTSVVDGDEEEGGGVELDFEGNSTVSTGGDNAMSSLVRIWKSLACCDGLHGAALGTAAKNGDDYTLTWLCNSLTFGGQVVTEAAERRLPEGIPLVIAPTDYDCRPRGYEREESELMVHPKPIPEVIATLKSLSQGNNDTSLASIEHELAYCIGMLEYVATRLSSAVVVENSRQSLHLQGGNGRFLNLHCGHNAQFSTEELYKLSAILKEATAQGTR